jgi:outer membrane protein OmpA-like peptidoglycan-associated protein
MAGAVLPALLAACASLGTLQTDHNTLVTDIAKAESSQWAMQCAPRELALANSHRDFAELEFQEGDARRAAEHLAIAHENIEKALEKAAECEPKDRDGDGLVDGSDACPDSPEDLDAFMDLDGCPDDDNDADGIADLSDACRDVPEDKDGDRDEDGCPEEAADRDLDGIADGSDACPDQAESKNDYLDLDGCPDERPSQVRITQDQIEIKEKIQFEVAKSRILPVSYGILNQVAQVLRDYPKITIRIEGHTDSDGSDAYNLKLSQQRAAAVLDYLIAQGLDAKRMGSVGLGETRPIDTNRTSSGRANNRRVEFHITSGM